MKRKTTVIIAGAALAAAVVAIPTAAQAGSDDTDTPITGAALEQASDAALAHLGEGTVSETEVGDEESLYEVEVTLDNGDQVDVQLDENFAVVGTENEGSGDDAD